MDMAQRFFARTTVAALLALAASSAQAIPLTFTFAATVKETITFDQFGNATTDTSHAGEAVAGALVVEIEGLVRGGFSDPSFGTFLLFSEPGNSGLISSVLNIGGVAYDVGTYDTESGGLQIFDSAGPQPGSFALDSVSVGHRSTNEPQIFDPTLTGVFDFRQLALGWHDPNNPFGLVDLSNPFEPLDVLNVPMGLITGSFSQSVETCDNGECFFTSDTITNFLFGSLTVTATQVPEPGTLGLFVLGLLGVGGMKKWRSGRDSNPRPPA